jgi:hypothetical protein
MRGNVKSEELGGASERVGWGYEATVGWLVSPESYPGAASGGAECQVPKIRQGIDRPGGFTQRRRWIARTED